MSTTEIKKREDGRIVLGILDLVSRRSAQSQRLMAAELGIALGLVNAYLKRCTKKGLVKVKEAPARRYFYYLTPLGFAEKSRLTVEYLSDSFRFFRQARMDCARVLRDVTVARHRRILLVGKSDLSEIMAICALDSGVEVIAVIDREAVARSTYIGVPLCSAVEHVTDTYDAAIVTDINSPYKIYNDLVAKLGVERVFIPELLRLRPERTQ